MQAEDRQLASLPQAVKEVSLARVPAFIHQDLHACKSGLGSQRKGTLQAIIVQ